MGFDYVLLNPGYRYLPTEQEKLDYFCDERKIPVHALPTKVYTGNQNAKTSRFFVDKYPIGIDPQTNRVTFSYIDDGLYSDLAFNTWLKQYTPLITQLGIAEIVYVTTSTASFSVAERDFAKAFPAAGRAFGPELLAYFEQRRDIETRGPMGLKQDQLDAYRRLSRRYAETSFHKQYTAWKDATAAPESIRLIRLSTVVLPFSYAWMGTAGVDK